MIDVAFAHREEEKIRCIGAAESQQMMARFIANYLSLVMLVLASFASAKTSQAFKS